MPKRARAALRWVPAWEGPIKAWAIKQISKNRWRCDSIHEFDDLLQDAFELFLKVCSYYPRVVEAPHFMALYKVSLLNQFHTQARYMQRKGERHVNTQVDVSELCIDTSGDRNNGYLQVLLAQAPEEVKLALSIMGRHGHALRGEDTNEQLCRILDYGGFDFVNAVHALLMD